MLWSRFAGTWPSLSSPERKACLQAAAGALQAAWLDGRHAADMPLRLLAFDRSGGAWRAQFPAEPPARHGSRLSFHTFLEVVADWHSQTADIVRPRDGLRFLRALMGGSRSDRAAVRHAVETITAAARSQARTHAAAVYHYNLHDSGDDRTLRRAGLRGHWEPDSAVHPENLLRQIEAAETAADARVLKSGPHIRVVRSSLLGHDALIKRYDLVSWDDWLKYHIRPSRARRAWAAARTLLRLGILTPEPLGYIEVYKGRIPMRSYIVTRFMPDAVNAYRFVKTTYHRHDDAWREAFRADLLKQLLLLYSRGMYHADTKLLNMMLEAPDDPAARRFYWIDLECVQAGVSPTRRQIVRNLVQLNGSMRYWVSDDDRLAFLRGMATEYPWLNQPRVIERIRSWTRRRLLKELHRHCGP